MYRKYKALLATKVSYVDERIRFTNETIVELIREN